MSEQLFTHPVQVAHTDERYTPKWIFDGLGETFDLDPASPGDGLDFVPALRRYTKDDDGLARDWDGFVWLNPPYSNSSPWVEKFVSHGDGIFLGPLANGKWVQTLVKASSVVWLCRDLRFVSPFHSGRHASMPLLMVGIGVRAEAAIVRLAELGVHDGTLLRVDR
jgi:hypothetical protein